MRFRAIFHAIRALALERQLLRPRLQSQEIYSRARAPHPVGTRMRWEAAGHDLGQYRAYVRVRVPGTSDWRTVIDFSFAEYSRRVLVTRKGVWDVDVTARDRNTKHSAQATESFE